MMNPEDIPGKDNRRRLFKSPHRLQPQVLSNTIRRKPRHYCWGPVPQQAQFMESVELLPGETVAQLREISVKMNHRFHQLREEFEKLHPSRPVMDMIMDNVEADEYMKLRDAYIEEHFMDPFPPEVHERYREIYEYSYRTGINTEDTDDGAWIREKLATKNQRSVSATEDKNRGWRKQLIRHENHRERIQAKQNVRQEYRDYADDDFDFDEEDECEQDN